MSTTPLAAVVGPTASGKTELALALAQRTDVEILVADSQQVYRGMDIGTAKPTAAAREMVVHHLLDLAAPDESFTVADWVARARALLPQVAARGRLPLIVGGTGLYLAALVDGFDFDHQPWAPDVRRRLTMELDAQGLPALGERLRRLDPAAAARTDLRNPRRVLRALERTEAAGGPVIPRADPYPGRVALLGISRPRAALDRRIGDRSAAMFAGGLLDEVRELLRAGYGSQLRPMSGHGYREAAQHLAGELTLAEALAITVRRTRQYARRQMTWFGRDQRIVWIAAGDRPADDPQIVSRAATALRAMLG